MLTNFMQLRNICSYQYFTFVGLIAMYVGTSELPTLNTEISQS